MPTQMANRIAADDRTTRRATVIVSALLIVLAVFLAGAEVLEQDRVRRVGLIGMVFAVLYVIGQLAVHAERLRVLRTDVNWTTANSLSAARAYLAARREYHSGLWLWSRVVALLPGLPIYALGVVRVSPDATVAGLVWRYVPYVWVAVLLLAVVAVQRPMARDYARQLRELDQLEH